MAAGALPAGVVQQPLPDVLPDRRLSVETDGIGLLDLDDPAAAGARHPEDMLGDFWQAQLPDRLARRFGPCAGARVP